LEVEHGGRIEELRRIVRIREQDVAEAFENISRIVSLIEKETLESKRWELLGRLKAAEAVFFSAVGKLLGSYRAYTAVLEKEAGIKK
jgi:hypothetical protein